jgi:hypothetical protein
LVLCSIPLGAPLGHGRTGPPPPLRSMRFFVQFPALTFK